MLSLEEKACNYDTFRHIERVRNLLNIAIKELLNRAEKHDQSKLQEPEVALFTEYTPKLASTTYGSQEYEDLKKAIKPALDHHYANNRHHPEYAEYQEKWLDLIGYEEEYSISNYGRLKSKQKEEFIRKPNITPKGYARIAISKNGIQKNKFIHNLVALTFIGKPANERMQVNHKNGIKLDNNVDNLEWVTPSQNLQHAYDNNLKEPCYKYVVHCNELNITTFGTEKMEEELKKLGYSKASSSAIHRCINSEGYATHLDLTFTSQNIDEYKEMNSTINQMNLFDLIEMLLDWKAASERHNDGNIRKSIEINGNRFNMSPQLIKIFENTVKNLL